MFLCYGKPAYIVLTFVYLNDLSLVDLSTAEREDISVFDDGLELVFTLWWLRV